MKNIVHKIFKKFGYEIVAQHLIKKMVNTSDRGLLGLDFYYLLPDYVDASKFQCCFDIGANLGQTTDKFIKYFPSAKIYSYEPVAETYQLIYKKFSTSSHVYIAKKALSDFEDASFEICLHESDQQNSLLNTSGHGPREKVSVTTLDEECKMLGISHINFLKIDTEGCELQVINGARRMISEGRIDFIYAEVGFQPEDKEHTFFLDLSSTLYAMGYGLLGIFENIHNGNPLQFHYANALFMLKRNIVS
jgi:FkbM family methyltransferase